MALPELSPREELFAVERAKGETVAEVAATLNLAPRTAYRWAADPAIVARVEALQAEGVADAMRFLKGRAMKAARRLDELLDIEDGKFGGAAVNLGSAKDMLDRVGLKAAENVNIRGAIDLDELTPDERAARLAALLDAVEGRARAS